MQPQTQQVPQAGSSIMASDGTKLDPTAATLTRAIRQVESQKNYNAKGASGEFGAYQWMPGNFEKSAQKYGLDPNDKSPINQDKVAYNSIKEQLDAGHTQSQVASWWNSGKYDSTGNVGINKQGVSYDTPKYVDNVKQAYLQNQNESSVTQTSTTQPKKQGFLSTLAHGLIEPVATTLARPVQAGAELLGASAEDVNKATKNIAGDYVAPVPQNFTDVAKDVGRAAQTVALGLPAEGIVGAAKMGAVAGAGAGLEQSGNVQGTLQGGLTGAVVGGIGGGIAKGIGAIPKWLAGDAFKGLNDAQIEKVLSEKSIGTTSNLLNQSKKALSTYGNQIDNILDKTTEQGGGDFSLRAVKSQFDNLSIPRIVEKIKNIIPAGNNEFDSMMWSRSDVLPLIDKIENGTATLAEKNQVRSVIDSIVPDKYYQKIGTAISGTNKWDLPKLFADSLRAEVKQSEPATIPIFSEFSKEMAINKAIQKVAKKSSGGLVRWSDIVPFMAGSGFAGLPGGLVAAGANRLASSPTTEFATAKGIQGIGKVVNPALSRAGLVPGLLKNRP